MQPIEHINALFEKAKKGEAHLAPEIFEVIWLNHTRMPHSAIKPLLDKIYEWAKQTAVKYPELLALTYLAMGTVAHHSDQFEHSLQCCNASFSLFSGINDKDGMAAASVYIGYVYRSLGEIDLALEYGLDGIEQLSKSGKHKMLLIIDYYWVGTVYAESGQHKDAIDLFNAGLSVDYEAGHEALKARLTNGIAGVYMNQKKYDLALEFYDKALGQCSEYEPTFKARGLTDLGNYYFHMGDYKKAIAYNEEALNLRRQMNIVNGSITNLMNLGNIAKTQGDLIGAIEIFKECLSLAESIRVKSKMYQIHYHLYELYLGLGKVENSLTHFKAFHEIREDVSHEDNERKVKNQQLLFEAKQTRKENAIIKQQKEQIEEKNRELQATIEELTITKISRRAKAITLFIAVFLIIIDTLLHHFVISKYAHNNYFILLASEGVLVLFLKPIENAVEHRLLAQVIKQRRKKEALQNTP